MDKKVKHSKKGALNDNSFDKNKIFEEKTEDNLDSQFAKTECELINNYIDLNNQALNFLNQNQFSKALSLYERALLVADSLNDDFKKNETECNKGIMYFNLNNIKKAIELLQQSFNYFFKICSNGNNKNDIKNLTLLCKSGCNLCMCKIVLAYNKDDCINIINSIINVISQQEDSNTQMFCVKYLNNILFKENSLLSINNNNLSHHLINNNIEANQLNSPEEINDEYNKINELYSHSFFNFIVTNKYEPWINTLNLLNQKMNELNDNSGKINILFNKQMAICLKCLEDNENNNIILNNYSELNNAKSKLSTLIQNLSQANDVNKIIYNYSTNIDNGAKINEDEINNIIYEYKTKLTIIREIYNILSSFESKLNGNMIYNGNGNNNEKNSDLGINGIYFLNSYLNYTKKYFEKNLEDENLKNNLINNIETALDAINNPQNSGLDFSNINIFSLDPQLADYYDTFLAKANDKNTTSTSSNNKPIKTRKKLKNKKKDLLNDFFENAYEHIYNGEVLTKINFGNNQTKKYYFQVENKIDHLQYFVSKNTIKTIKNQYDFDNILKVKIGMFTKNVIKKSNNLDIIKKNKKSPYRFMSFIFSNDFNKKTLDIVFEDGKSAKKWFYGLYYYFVISKRTYKICSCTNYLLFRIKSKMINKMNLDNEKIKDKSFAYYIKKYFNKYKKK